jgi:two-component system, sensor histidine kinase
LNKYKTKNQYKVFEEDIQLDSFPENYADIQRIKLHIHVLKQVRWLSLVTVLTLALLFYKSVPFKHLITWGMLVLAIEFFRASYIIKIESKKLHLKTKAIKQRFYVLALLSAISISGCVFFLANIPIYNQMLVALIVLSLPNLFVSAALFPVLLIYMIVLVIPFITLWIQMYPQQLVSIILLNLMNNALIISFFFDRDKQFRFSILMHIDRTRIVEDLALKNIEILKTIEKAEQASQARARVLAAASHDLRQPLQALSVYSAVLLSSPDPKTLPNVAENIDRLVRVLGSLLHGLLDLSRLSNDYYVPERQRISLDRLAADICNEFAQQAGDKNLKLIQELGYVRLLDDKVGISRIIRNLLDNAIKYTDHGEVTVSTYQQGGTAFLTVTDTGKGIPDEEKLHIYEEFYQLHNPGRDLSRGIGLGLTIVQRLCELIGIQIQLESELGKGSSFKLVFDSVLKEPLNKPSSKPFQPADLAGKRIYIVDDEQDILDSMRTLLHTWEMVVDVANSGAAIRQLIETQGVPDLMMIDLRLGHEHGAHLAKQLQSAFGTFPVLVMTGETASTLLQETYFDGFTVLFKPINQEVLLGAFGLILTKRF